MNDASADRGRERRSPETSDIPRMTPEDIRWVQKHRKQEDAWVVVRARWAVIREGIGTLIWILGVIASIIVGINYAGDWVIRWLKSKGVG